MCVFIISALVILVIAAYFVGLNRNRAAAKAELQKVLDDLENYGKDLSDNAREAWKKFIERFKKKHGV